jgi:hypothetical protein
MTLQIDGNTSLQDQETQLQAVETFFVEVIDYQAGDNSKNAVTTSPISGPVASPIHLKTISSAAELAQVASGASGIVFDRVVFVAGQRQRVVGFRN